MAFLTMDGGIEQSRFSPCFPLIYAALVTSLQWCLMRPETPRRAPYLSPRSVPRMLACRDRTRH